MSKYTKRVQQAVSKSVLDCMLMRYSVAQTAAHIEKVHNIKLKDSMVETWRYRLRKNSREEYKELMKDDFSYHYTFMQRIDELKLLQYKQWDLYEATTSDFVKHNCLKELHSLSVSLANLYHDLPMISLSTTANRDNNKNGNISQTLSVPLQTREPTEWEQREYGERTIS